MRLNRMWVVTVSLATILLVPVFGFSGGEMPEEMIIDNRGYKSEKKGPVPFSHQTHAEDYGLSCDECHHVFESGKNVWEEGDEVQTCKTCHDPRESKGEAKKLQIAFHRACKDCHKESGSNEAPYRKCYECHKKK